MKDEEKYKEITRAQKLASNVTAAVIAVVTGAVLLAFGLSGSEVLRVSRLVVPVVLLACGLALLAGAIIQKNTVTLYLSVIFFTASAVSFIAHFSPVGYDKLYPAYILSPAIASFVTMFMSGEYKFHLRLIVFFAVSSVLFFLASFGVAGWSIIVPALIIFAGLAALYLALAVNGSTEE